MIPATSGLVTFGATSTSHLTKESAFGCFSALMIFDT